MFSGSEVQEGMDICIPMVDTCCCMIEKIQYCKAVIFQLKKIIFKKYVREFMGKMELFYVLLWWLHVNSLN